MSDKKYEYKPLEFDGDEGQDMDVWAEINGVWHKLRVEDLYTRHEVEEPEPRKPRDWWAYLTPHNNAAGYMMTKPGSDRFLVREVVLPVVKELPDQMGVWTREGTPWTVNISQRLSDGKLETSDSDDPQWVEVDRLPKGRWLFVTPLIQQAWEDSK